MTIIIKSIRTSLLLTILLTTGIVTRITGQTLDSIRSDNGMLYFHEYGQGETIILLTGGPGNNSKQLAEVASMLGKNHRIILLEQRGTGLSMPLKFDSTSINLSNAGNDIKLLLNKLDLKEVILCGHSWGATLAMYFASIYPKNVKSLILIAPGPDLLGDDLEESFSFSQSTRWSVNEKSLIDSLRHKQNAGTITPTESAKLSYVIRLAYISNKSKLDSIYSKINVSSNSQMRSLMFQSISQSKINFKTSLQKLERPVYIICGRQDFLLENSYELKIAYPEFKLYLIQNCGHFPMYEQPTEFYQIMNSIIHHK